MTSRNIRGIKYVLLLESIGTAFHRVERPISLALPMCKAYREIYCSSASSRPGVLRPHDQTRIHSYHVL
jgi:hypothetical protein